MKTSDWVLIVSVFLVALVLIFFNPLNLNMKLGLFSTENKTNDTDEINLTVDYGHEAEVFGQAVEEGNMTVCNELSNETARDECLANFIITEAEKSLNMSLCSKLSGDYKTNCRYQTAVKIVSKERDTSVCNKLEDEHLKNSCKNSMVVER